MERAASGIGEMSGSLTMGSGIFFIFAISEALIV
jgi:hypothetical protein